MEPAVSFCITLEKRYNAYGYFKKNYFIETMTLMKSFLQKIYSDHGLLTTVAYQFGPKSQPMYALEGSVSVAGTALSWLKNNLNIFEDFNNLPRLPPKSSTDLYFVPAFCGLNAPYWCPEARRLAFIIIRF